MSVDIDDEFDFVVIAVDDDYGESTLVALKVDTNHPTQDYRCY